MQALARAREWPEPLGDAATDLLADPDPRVRRDAVAAFAAHPGEVRRSTVALREALAEESDDETRALLGELLERL